MPAGLGVPTERLRREGWADEPRPPADARLVATGFDGERLTIEALSRCHQAPPTGLRLDQPGRGIDRWHGTCSVCGRPMRVVVTVSTRLGEQHDAPT